jgi:predicted acetyltransferase
MKVELKELTLSDGKDIYDMIQSAGRGENGFLNTGYGLSYAMFQHYLEGNYNMAKGIGLRFEYVPQTMFWLYIDDKPVGIGKLRHYLNASLLVVGGHIGYSIIPSERGKGFGNIILSELLKKAKEKGIDRVLLTCNLSNTASRKVIEKNGGVLEDIVEGKCRYWISVN